MPIDPSTAFVSYSREDAEEFALRLAEDLRSAGASIWLDQLDLEPGKPWDVEIQQALSACPRMLVILSPSSVNSPNVLDEVSYALRKQKTVIPVLQAECDIPFRLDRLERIDFTKDYSRGLTRLLRALGAQPTFAAPPQTSQETVASTSPVEKKIRELQHLAESDDETAMVELGDAYRDGELVAKDLDQALTWYRRAAAAGNATGMYRVGLAYNAGQGVQPDHFQAVTWYRKAAEKGEPYGMFNLAYMLEFGQGVEQNYNEAREWYKKSEQYRPEDVQGALERISAKEGWDKARLEQKKRERLEAKEKARQEELERQRTAAEQARLEEERRLAKVEKARQKREREHKAAEERSRQDEFARQAISPVQVPSEPPPILDFQTVAQASNEYPTWVKPTLVVTGIVLVAVLLYWAFSSPTKADKQVQEVREPNAGSTTASTPITIQPPVISIQPASQSISPGQTASISVSAGSKESLAYQWYLGASGDTSQPISEGTGTRFTTPKLQESKSYWVRVRNSVGFVDSMTAKITVPPTHSQVTAARPGALVPQAGEGGVLTNINNGAQPKATPQRVRVSQGVSQGLLVHQVKPEYPRLARAARVQGTVVLRAIIRKDGSVENLDLVSGHPMLAPAAIDAVKQWKYKPYFLNGEPVEVETTVNVNFTLAGG